MGIPTQFYDYYYSPTHRFKAGCHIASFNGSQFLYTEAVETGQAPKVYHDDMMLVVTAHENEITYLGNHAPDWDNYHI